MAHHHLARRRRHHGMCLRRRHARGGWRAAPVVTAIVLTVHLGVPLHGEDAVLDTATVANTVLRAEGDDSTPVEVEQFRRFLDTSSPDHFAPD
jgi:hypothetical protein